MGPRPTTAPLEAHDIPSRRRALHPIFDDRRYLIPFRAALLPHLFTDVLVIGSGVAGLRAALAAADHSDVVVLAKADLDDSNTAWAQGGIAAVTEAEDRTQDHVRDTLVAGAGLCNESVVRRIVEAAPAHMRQLIDLGMPFDRDGAGALQRGREGGHGRHRVLHADGDGTGRVLVATLLEAVRRHESIRLFDHCFALDLLSDAGDGGRCLGAITHHQRFGLQVIWAPATILASGGSGQVYRETTNPPVATGDGLAMAYRAGAAVADVEFTQFHPTTLYVAGATRSLISEGVRGEGAHLVNAAGERFMVGEHELAELAPRDIVARAIHRQLALAGDKGVFLDPHPIGAARFIERFPSISATLRQFDIDPGADLIPIRPAAHYAIGGLWVDARGRTSIDGLYACGEAACTGLHGANRLASNSLLEGLVCGLETGLDCLDTVRRGSRAPLKIVSDIADAQRTLDLADIRSSLVSLMWRRLGIERDGEALEDVAARIDLWASYTLEAVFDERPGWEVQNLLCVARLTTRAAARRRESRGTHFRVDFPVLDPGLAVHLTWRRGDSEPTTA